MTAPDLSVKRTAFRAVAFAEALSWLGLLVGMFFKYVTETSEAGVKIFGPIHGGIFLLYLAVTLWVARPFRWSPVVLLAALVSAIPPFATAIFEVWADRRGLIGAAPQNRSADGAQRSPSGVPD
jgi:integral membrane protein